MMMVAKMMLRKRIMHIGKRSRGRIPIVYANDEMPCVAWAGRPKITLGTVVSIKIGEVGSAN
jgi:hypothetical protein